MAQLILIRHGQAAAFSADSDRLTELGVRQARALADHLIADGQTFDAVHTGTLRRQVQTEQAVAEVYRAAGQPWPEAKRAPAWDEYDAAGITGHLMPLLSEREPEFARLVSALEAHLESPERNRYFQRMFEVLMDRWASGSVDHPDVEPFADFHARVSRARSELLSEPGGRRVALFTSGGPIGVFVQLALQAPAAACLMVNWRVRNASLSEFVFSKGRISLESFNRYPHLADRDLQSYR